MKITVITALVAATFALAPLAHANEGNGDPFSFSAGPVAVTQIRTDGTAVALADQPAVDYATREDASLQTTDEVVELAANDRTGESESGR